MRIENRDFNDAENFFSGNRQVLWNEISGVIADMPLHLKASDQSGKQGSLIFDPVGTNETIKTSLIGMGWSSGVPMPPAYKFLGSDVDFVKNDILVEVQFSNYPFLVNNIVRSELLYRDQTIMGRQSIKGVVIIAKARMFPASNSTLYYEQAVTQTRALARKQMFDVPVRVVGMFENYGVVPAVFTEYPARYSRTPANRANIRVNIQQAARNGARALIERA